MIVFVCGVDMEPGSIRARFGSARFTGIGSVAVNEFPEFAVGGDRIWGLILEGTDMVTGEAIEIRRRDGSVVTGVLATVSGDVSDRAALVAQARYWELPVAYWRELVEVD